MAQRRKNRRRFFIGLLGGRCNNCSENNPDLLEFDHVNPKTKEFDLNAIKDGNEDRIKKELKKCVLLCTKCHLEKTKRNKEHINKDKKPARHGTIWMYIGYKCRCPKCKKSIREYLMKKKNL